MKQPTEIVYLTWVDSFDEKGWQRKLPGEESLTCVTVAFLVDETEQSIAITPSYGCLVGEDDFSVDSPMRIPKVAILRMEKRKAPSWLDWRLPPKGKVA